VDVAAALELRGYARGAPRRAAPPRRSRYSWRFVACGAAIAALGLGARSAGAGGFDAYPTIAIDTDPATLALAALVAAPLPAAAAGPENPTFAKDVAPIFQEKCQACHRPGSMAPMSLLTYQDARPWARAIRTQVASRTMPT